MKQKLISKQTKLNSGCNYINSVAYKLDPSSLEVVKNSITSFSRINRHAAYITWVYR